MVIGNDKSALFRVAFHQQRGMNAWLAAITSVEPDQNLAKTWMGPGRSLRECAARGESGPNRPEPRQSGANAEQERQTPQSTVTTALKTDQD